MTGDRIATLDVFGCALTGTTLIEASAGTGKTWAICGLYLRLLLERALPVQRILVVTFTQAATAELRDRIRARIVEALGVLRGSAPGPDPFVTTLLAALRARGLRDEAMARDLDRARAGFDEAAIFTIHAFCQRALAETPFAAQMPLALELLEDDALLRREVVNDFWRQRTGDAELSEGLAACLLAGGDTPETLDRLLARRLAKPLAQLRWPDDTGQPPPLELAALRTAHAAARDPWRRRKDEIVDAVQRSLPQLNRSSYKPETLQKAAADWEQLLLTDDPLPALPCKAERAPLLASARLRQGTKSGGTTPQDPFFDVAQALLDARTAAAAALATHRLAFLKALLDEGGTELRRRKRERRVVAFDDMLINLHQRLGDGASPWLAAALRERFAAALIDEFQDTDPLQFEIFQRIYGGHDAPRFFVGDPKQAIYSFRNADLHTYLGARAHARVQLTLRDNQRSSAELIDAFNALFSANRHAFMLPRLDFRPADVGAKPRAVFVDRTEPRAPLHVWLLPTEHGTGLRKAAALAAASRACAAEIARLLRGAARGDVTLDGRPLRAGDIAVLVRTHRHGSLVRDALRTLGVGSVEVSQASVFHTADAEELERLLHAVLEPSRDGALRAALATEILGRDAAAIDALDGDESAGVALTLRFADYREQWLHHGISAMLRRLMHDEGVSERLLARSDGERRMTNLLHLAERLQHASAEHRWPQALLRWLGRMRQDERGDEAAQLRLDSDRNLVQIITVHRAKGLEYPLVFCPMLWDGGAPRDPADGLEYHDDEGRAVIDFRPEARRDSAIALRRRTERWAEELRLIYVALTRAAHRCVLVAGCHGAQHVTTSARGMLNWLVAGDGLTPADWCTHKPGADGIARAWSGLAARAGGRIVVEPLPSAAGVPIDAPRPAPETILALDAPRSIVPGWRIGSFSGMLAGAGLERPAADHDADAPAPDAAPGVPGDDDILGFPRGLDAGTCLHAMFERADFGDPQTWRPAVRSALALVPQTLPGPDAAGRLERMALSMIGDVVRTPLPCGFALQDVDRARRVDELEFHLPARGVSAASLNRVLARFGYGAPPLGFGTLDGYLNGFIDLVFEHAGRYWLLDWKSNHLGDSAAAYGPAALQAEMARHGYHLQQLLYAVALDRHLALRLPHYDRAAHFGGALYLFVRAVRPAWQAGGAPAGVVLHRPPDAVIDALSALLGGGARPEAVA